MNPKIKELKDKFFDYSMLRWVLVGVTTAVIDYLIFITLYGPIDSVFIANLISASIATSLNYFTHHQWTFKSDQNHSRSGVMYLVNITFWWLISTSIIKALIVLGIDPKIAKMVPILLIAPINYFVLNKIIFKKKTKNPFA
jgi:putative flippase GtrA